MGTVRTSARSRTAAAAAACVIGASAGLIAAATPAAAGNVGGATYNCADGMTTNTTWTRSTTGKLRVAITRSWPVLLAPGDLSLLFGGMTLPSDGLPPLTFVASSASAPLSTPPSSFTLHYAGPYAPPYDTACVLVAGSTSGSWPV